MANPFENRGRGLPLNERPAQDQVSEQELVQTPMIGAVKLPGPKPVRRPCTLYLDVALMDQVRRVSKERGVTLSVIIESCLRSCLDNLE